jgi:predicted MFS family arabinose efflux permease
MVRNTRLISSLLAAEILATTGFSTFASLLVELSRLWHLDPARAGWIASSYLMGYAVAVPALVGMTDSVDPRSIYAAGCAIGFVAGGGFASLASGFWSGLVFRAMAGRPSSARDGDSEDFAPDPRSRRSRPERPR